MEENKNEFTKNDANQTTNHVPDSGPIYNDYDTEIAQEFVPKINTDIDRNKHQTNNYFADEYDTEAAAEFAPPMEYDVRRREGDIDRDDGDTGAGRVFGYIALALAILSLFTAPVLFGIVAIVLGFIAKGRGAGGSASWAIGLGALSVIVSLFLAPFF